MANSTYHKRELNEMTVRSNIIERLNSNTFPFTVNVGTYYGRGSIGITLSTPIDENLG